MSLQLHIGNRSQRRLSLLEQQEISVFLQGSLQDLNAALLRLDINCGVTLLWQRLFTFISHDHSRVRSRDLFCQLTDIPLSLRLNQLISRLL